MNNRETNNQKKNYKRNYHVENKRKRESRSTIKTILYFIVLILIIGVGVIIYSKYNFYDFTKGVREGGGKTSFSRDYNVKYSEKASYEIENIEFNDAVFFKKITVTPNTAYKVICKAKTENVINKEGKVTGGAQIAINNTTECSRALTGNNDWTELTFMFNSNNRTELEIGFRLGGYEEYSKGKAWFSDFKIEQGSIDTDKNWHMACFIIENINIKNIDGRNVKLSISDKDISTIKNNMSRLQDSIKEISGNRMSITYDIINIEKTLTSLSYDKENEYYASPDDVASLIDKYVNKAEYDYIYVAVRLGDLNKSNEVLVHDWIGLRSNGIQSNRIFKHKTS